MEYKEKKEETMEIKGKREGITYIQTILTERVYMNVYNVLFQLQISWSNTNEMTSVLSFVLLLGSLITLMNSGKKKDATNRYTDSPIYTILFLKNPKGT